MNKSKKIVCLMMLLSRAQINTFSHLKVTNMYITNTECTFVFNEVLKHSRPNYCQTLNIQNISRMPRVMFTCRSASTSKAKIAGLNIKTILNSANWTKDNIFKYYFKEILENYQTDHSNFGMELLDNII